MSIFSEGQPKGSDCYDQFSTMQECFSRYPTVYNKTGNEDDDDDDGVGALKDDGQKSANDFVFGGFGTDDNADTVDQIEEASASSSSKSDEKPNDLPTQKSN